MTKNVWKLPQLRVHVEQNYSVRLVELVDSLSRSFQIFAFHITEARAAMDLLVDPTEKPTLENVTKILGWTENPGELRSEKLAAEAHLISCLYSIRSILDIFANLIDALLLDRKVGVEHCDIRRVRDRLPDCAFKAKLSEVMSSDWFKYVNAFINTTKHRQLIRQSSTVSFEQDRVGIHVDEFKYGGQDFPAFWATDVLEGVSDLANQIVALGKAFNETVEVQASGDFRLRRDRARA